MNIVLRRRSGVLCLYIFIGLFLFSCKKNTPDIPEKKHEKWRTEAKTDSIGNKYYVVSTLKNTLEIRVDDKNGKTIFKEVYPTIDSTELPKNSRFLHIFLVAPNKYININSATLSFRIVLDDLEIQKKYIQVIANIDLANKKFYTKKYTVHKPEDWTYALLDRHLVQWYQNTLLVREGTDNDLNRGGGHMGLGQRGSQLVCYERDFSIRYTKDIDASDAYYPSGGIPIIPINNYEYILFRKDGIVARLQIVTSVEDKWSGKKPVIWQDNLKETNNIPADYSIKITDYNIQNNMVTANYAIYDEKGIFKTNRTRKWALNNGMPLGN